MVRYVIVAAAVLAILPAGAQARVRARGSRFDVTYSIEGKYSNTVLDGEGSCGVSLQETAVYHAGVSVRELKLKLANGASKAKHGTLNPFDNAAGGNSFDVSGAGYPANDCNSPAVPITCTGPIGPTQPVSPSAIATVRKGKVHFFVSLGTSAYGENDPMGGTCVGSTPFDAGGPTGYLGVSDAVDPYLSATASFSIRKLAQLRKGHKLETEALGYGSPPLAFSPPTCNHLADGVVIVSCTGTSTQKKKIVVEAR